MKNYIGYPLETVLNELNGCEVEVIYNTQNVRDCKSLFVTKMVFDGEKYLITVSSFKIEVE